MTTLTLRRSTTQILGNTTGIAFRIRSAAGSVSAATGRASNFQTGSRPDAVARRCL